jgi:deoxyribodipyrimidine photo-lyase
MPLEFKLSLFIFRRDLRLEDNTALNAALARSERVAACFICDPRQLEGEYAGSPAISFMSGALHGLAVEIEKAGGKLYFFSGEAEDVAAGVLSANKIDAVFFNRDYTPFSLKRDAAIAAVSGKAGVKCFSYDDALLFPPGSVLTGENKPYTVFTPFMRNAMQKVVGAPQKRAAGCFFAGRLKGNLRAAMPPQLPDIKPCAAHCRAAGLKILGNIGAFANYAKTRNLPAIATTGLSPHNKFGTVSIREVWYAIARKLGPDSALLRELCWRDFFTHAAFHFPHVFGSPFKKQYASLSWQNNEKLFAAWRAGETGFPLVDAAMRELAETGFMHGRARMAAASFLIKDLHIDWRLGEKYFAQSLCDYDPAVNNGNWQWCASTGCDAQPWFRIFNPALQLERFDPDCRYVRRWVKELSEYSPDEIHALRKGRGLPGYPAMIINHAAEVAKTKTYYSGVSGKI